jgi:PPOX class probable F420-dependent enzyme
MTTREDDRRRGLELLARARVAHLATADAAARPHVVPFCFAVIGDWIFSVVDEKPKRTKTGLRRLTNIAENPRASVVADHYDEDWSTLWFVKAEGEAALVADDSEYERALAALQEKYPQYRSMGLARRTHPMIRIRIERLVLWRGGGPG